MSDSGEGLVDASTRLAERIEEIEESRKQARPAGPRVDPERVRERELLRLARTDISRQLDRITHEARRVQLRLALEELDRRLEALDNHVRGLSAQRLSS
jgi:hypothetical protein